MARVGGRVGGREREGCRGVGVGGKGVLNRTVVTRGNGKGPIEVGEVGN
jgi:hypothetical protein